MAISHRQIESNGISMHLAEAGEGPLVLLLHGFPELWYSWRNQLEALGQAGYHAVAPDLRGYGRTDAPSGIEQYSMLRLVGDVIGIADELGAERFVVAGHDWGSPLASNVGLLRPDRVRGVALLSVPYLPRGDTDVLTSLTALLGPDNYQAQFQEPGVAESVMEADVRAAVLGTLIGMSGDATQVHRLDGSWSPDAPVDVPLPRWLSDEDVEYYVAEFERTGYRGPLNWYRNSRENWELMAAWHHALLTLPSLYIGGDRDTVYHWPGISDLIGVLKEATMPGLTKAVVLEGCGHWTQQERPDEVSALLCEFVAGLPS